MIISPKQIEAFWSKRLAQSFPPVDLPINPVNEHASNFIDLKLSTSLTERILEICVNDDHNILCFFQCIFSLTIRTWCNQSDFFISSPPLYKDAMPPENLSPIISPIEIIATQSFKEFFKGFRESYLTALRYQNYSLPEIKKKLSFNNKEFQDPSLWIGFESLGHQHHIYKAPFYLNIRLERNQFVLEGYPSAHRYSTNTICDFIQSIHQITTNALSTPESAIASLNYLDPSHKSRLIKFGHTPPLPDHHKNRTLHTWFKSIANKRGDAVALQLQEKSISYATLDELSDRLAGTLLNQYDVQPGNLIAIMTPPNEWTIIAILGVLKSACTYIPLDSNHPQERIDYILQDCDANILLFHESESSIPSSYLGTCLPIEKACMGKDKVCINTDSKNIAYLIYTSGTTGKPKGCLVSHQNVSDLIVGTKALFEFQEKDVWVLFHSYCFDFSVWEIFGSLLNGGSLVIPSSDVIRDGRNFWRFIDQFGVTILNQTPASFYVLASLQITDQGRPSLHSLRHIIFGGERLNIGRLKDWIETYPLSQVQMVNMYGITETTVHVTYLKIENTHCSSSESPIGKPLPGYETYVLNEDLQLLPELVTGELYVGGTGLSAGYLNKNNLTKERFIPHPFKAGEKLYKTGDLCCWTAEGSLLYKGRIDRQIKVRGYRIEPGEIEKTLLMHDFIQSAVITTFTDNDEISQLVGYYQSSQEINPEEVRNHLKAHLPAYMIPSFIIQVREIPLTTNGKIDFTKLPSPHAKATHNNETNNKTLKQLSTLWSEVLGQDIPPDTDINYFEKGGHSLNAMKLASRISEKFKVAFTIRDVFLNASLGKMSDYLDTLKVVPDRDIPKAANKKYYTLTPAQKRMYILEALSEGSNAYTIQYTIRSHAKIDNDRLKATLRTLIDRYEILRTSFEQVDGVPVQIIHPSKSIPLNLQWNILTPGASAPAQKKYLFDLSRPPLFQLTLVEHPNGFTDIHFIKHHIIADGWSMEIFADELLSLYENHKRPMPKWQYRDFSEWQTQQLNSEASQKSKAWWQTHLSLPLPVMEFPADYPRPATRTFSGSWCPLSFPKEISKSIRRVASTYEASPFMFLLTSLNILFFKYLGAKDQIIGIPASGRTLPALENQLGLFLHTLAIRSQLNPNHSFSDFLQQVRSTLIEAYAHQNYPFEQLVEDLNLSRSLDHNPLFNVMLVYQEDSYLSKKIFNKELSHLAVLDREVTTSKFDLTFHLQETNGELVGGIEYNTEIFKANRIALMGQHFVNILTHFLTSSSNSIQDAQIESTSMWKQIDSWSSGKTIKIKETSIVSWFQKTANLYSTRTALRMKEESWTYAVLEKKAEEIAHELIRNEIEPGEIVGLMGKRSPYIIAALLGIFKAGGVVLPLAVDDPRNEQLLSDSRCRITWETDRVITTNHTKDKPKTKNFEKDSFNNPDSIAYLLYTSGSTGTPKGCIVSHQNLVNYFTWACEFYFNDTEEGNFGWLSPLSFDFTWTVVFCTLLRGRTLEILPEDTSSEDNLRHALAPNSGIDSLKLTPSHIRMLKEMKLPESNLRLAICGGESLLPQDVITLRLNSPGLRIFNEYGPTETTIGCTVQEVTDPENAFLIGHPIANTKIKVIDKYGQLCPPGIPGELLVGGNGVAKGYFKNKKETQQKFVNGYYHTGDLVEWTTSGILQYRGRIDQQIKIRGHRIEPNEIEQNLLSLEGIVSVALKVWTEGKNERLVCYYVSRNKQTPDEIRKHLQKKLPGFMLPSGFVCVDNIPLTENGKIAYALLPSPQKNSNTHKPPSNETEEWLLTKFKTVLDDNHLNIDDNFFESGGHSLNGVQLLSLIHEQSGVSLRLSDLFRNPTVSELASYLQHDLSSKEVEKLSPAPLQEHYPVSPAQQRLHILHQLTGTHGVYNIYTGLVIDEPIHIPSFEKAVERLAQRHESLRTFFTRHKDQLVQQIQPFPDFTVPIEHQTIDENDWDNKAYLKAQEVARTHFTLSLPPLWKLLAIRKSDKSYLVMLVMHHIIGDGWSLEIFVNELLQLYHQEQNKSIPPLPPLDIQYKDYTWWQLKRLTNKEYEAMKSYWIHQLEAPLPKLSLFPDHPRQRQKQFGGGLVNIEFPENLGARLRLWGQSRDLTLYMCTLGGFQLLLHLYSGQQDILIGTPVAGRERTEFTAIIGCFLNTLVIRSRLTNIQHINEFFNQTRLTVLSALENQGYPFDKLVEHLNLDRDVSRSVLFDVMMVFQEGQFHHKNYLAALSATKNFEIKPHSSKYDLVLHLEENEGMLYGALEFDNSLFDNKRIELLAHQYLFILEQIVSGEKTFINDIQLLPNEERLWINKIASQESQNVEMKILNQNGDLAPIGIPGTLQEKVEGTWRDKGANYRWTIDEQLELIENTSEAKIIHKKANLLDKHIQSVAKLWEEVLEIELPEKSDANFFALGGHSLNAMRLLMKFENSLGIQVALSDIFLYPTLTEMATRVEELKGKQLDFIPKSKAKKGYRLSSAQLRMFILDSLNRGATVYHIHHTVVLYEKLSLSRLKSAVAALITRHEILRTGFQEGIPEPIQAVFPLNKIKIPVYQLSENTKEKITKPFVLDQPPLFRIYFIPDTEGSTTIHLEMHHIIGDGWSLEVLATELLTYYKGEPEPVPLRLQYYDYAEWQRNQLSSRQWENSRQWWHQHFNKPSRLLNLPTDRPRPQKRSFSGGLVFLSISDKVVSKLKEITAKKNGTIFMALSTILKIFLYRYSGEDEQIIGYPIANRNRPELANQIGLYLNTIALRSIIHAHENFITHLLRERDLIHNALAHQEYPFDELVNGLDLPRYTDRNPIFDIMLVYQEDSYTGADLQLKPGTRTPFENTNRTFSKFDLTFYLQPQNGLLQGYIEFNRDIFNKDRIEKMAEHLATFIEQVVERPIDPIQDLPLSTEAENQQIIEWSKGRIKATKYPTIMSWFSQTVTSNADKIAILDQDGDTITYAELEKQSSQIASGLLNQGISPGSMVALTGERSINLIVSLLAILKAGGVAIPIRREDPRGKLMLESIDCSWHLSVSDGDPFDSNIQLLSYANLLHSKIRPLPNISDDAPAYILFTSGSTGIPKGCMIRHRNLQNYLSWACRAYFTAEDQGNFAWFSPLSFDFTWTVIFCNLLRGKRLYVYPESQDIAAILTHVFTSKISNAVKLTPSHIRMLTQLNLAEANMELIISGGEELLTEDIQHLFQVVPEARLFNEYGPTESTIGCVVKQVFPHDKGNLIGMPIDNVEVEVRSIGGINVCPIGIPGELWIKGKSVGIGYANNETETARAFDKGWYKTGDSVEWLSKGGLRYHGRIDRQWNIRGHRVEPGEIEAAIMQMADISNAIVTLGDDQIIAYYVSATHITSAYLSRKIKNILPSHMIPSLWIALAEVPLNAHGKIDLSALPKPVVTLQQQSFSNVHEQWMASLWKEVLSYHETNLKSNFFEMGGHSLTALHLLSLIRNKSGKNPDLHQLFTYPVLEDFSRLVESLPIDEDQGIPIAPPADDYPLSPGQKRLWLLHQMEGNSIAYNMHGHLTLPIHVTAIKIENALNTLVSRHEALRTRFGIINGEPRQWILPQAEIAVEHINPKDDQELKEKIFELNQTDFQLHEKLIRVALIRTSQHWELFWVMHHIISDGISLEILGNELESILFGKIEQLPSLPTTLKDYSVWINQRLKSPPYVEHQEFWKQTLSNPLSPMTLPRDHISMCKPIHTGSAYICYIKNPVLAALKDATLKHGVSLYMILVTGLKIVLSRILGQNDMLIGTPVSGRNRYELQGLVGFFLNTVIIRSYPTPTLTLIEYLNQVKEQVLLALRHQDYPFDQLIADLRIPRSSTSFPITSIFLNLITRQDLLQQDISDFSSQNDPHQLRLKFDINFYISEYANGLQIHCDYQNELFNAETIALLCEKYIEALNVIITDPDRKLAHFSTGWSPLPIPSTPNIKGNTLPDAFLAMVTKYPDAIALQDEHHSLTYQELYSKSLRAGQYLIREAPDVEVVAILADHDIPMVIAVWAVLLAGKTYVPIALSSPEIRIHQILKESGASILLWTKPVRFQKGPSIATMSIDSLLSEPEVLDLNQATISSQERAYILYTSGSTGKPVGYAQTHKGLLHYIQIYGTLMNIVPEDRIAGISPFVYDSFNNDLFGALLNGATYCLLDLKSKNSPAEWCHWVLQMNITIWHSIPEVFLRLSDSACQQEIRFPALRQYKMTGESSSYKHYEAFTKIAAPHARFVVTYGLTESTFVCFNSLRLDNKAYPPYLHIPVGFPISGVQIRILNHQGKFAHKLEKGEIIICSPYLAKPIHKNKESEFIDSEGTRWYRTGDLGRFLADGQLEVNGRADRQIKILGVRVAPEEIENILSSHPDIHQSAIIPSPPNKSFSLQAFVVKKPNNNLSIDDVHKFLADRLPPFMMPNTIQWIVQLPKLPSGKVDLHQLSLVSQQQVLTPKEVSILKNPTEEALANLWIEILEDDDLPGPHENFFDLGGDSLKAIQVINKIKEKWHKEIDPQLLLYRTLRQISEEVKTD